MAIQSIHIEFNDGSKGHLFTLGHGSCGREVTKLEVDQSIDGVFEIVQTCADKPDEPDFFGYVLRNVRRYRIYNTDDPYPAKVKQ